MNKDEYFMYQALIEARKAEPISSPNPAVGAVIVKNEKIIGKGHTQHPGKPHAEVMAIRNSKKDVSNSTMYVTLEPCSHFGRTPPCTDLIIEKKIKRVVIGIKDVNPVVKGITKLKKAGVSVEINILKNKVRDQLQWYLKFMKTKLPYTTMKAGITVDGKITDYEDNSKWITSKKGREISQKLREINDGIVVGINTILSDNPKLTYRGKVNKTFYRIIFDTNLKIPLTSNVLKEVKNHKTIIVTKKGINSKKVDILKKNDNINLIYVPLKNGKLNIKDAMKEIGKLGIAKIIIEGGSEINYSFLKENMVDKLFLIISPKIIGGRKSKGFIGGKGFKLKDAMSIKNPFFYNSISDNIIFNGYINYYKY